MDAEHLFLVLQMVGPGATERSRRCRSKAPQSPMPVSLCGSQPLAPSLTLAKRRQLSQAWGIGPAAWGVDVSAELGLATRGSGFN